MPELLKSAKTGKSYYRHEDGRLEEAQVFKSPSNGGTYWKGKSDGFTKLHKYEAPAPAAPPPSAAPAEPDAPWYQEPVRYANQLVQSIGSGLTMGYDDEAAAALDSPFVAGYRTLVEGHPFDIGKAYEDRRDVYRGEAKEFTKDYPVSAVVGELTGAVASPINKLLGPVATAQKAIQAGRKVSMAEKMGRAAGVGALYGAGFGSGKAEGDIYDRLTGGVEGAILGTILGAAAPPLIAGVKAAGRAGLQKVLNNRGGLTRAEQKLSAVIRNIGGGDLSRGIKAVQAALTRGGDDTVLADATGIGGQRLARGASAAGDETAAATRLTDDFVTQRAKGRGPRMERAADELAPQGFHDRIDDLATQRRASSAPLYEEAFAPITTKGGKTVVPWDERLQAFLDEPYIQKGLAEGYTVQRLEALADNVPFNPMEMAIKGLDDAGNVIIEGTPNLRTMDMAKRGLDQLLEAFRSDITGKIVHTTKSRAIEKVRKALVSKLDDITTNWETGQSTYKAARAAYAGPSKLIDAGWRGRRFAKGDEEMLPKILKGMSEGEREAFELGVRREISSMIQKDTQTATIKFADKKADLWARIDRVFEPKKAKAFKRAVDEEIKKRRTEDFISPRSGSPTQGRQEDVKALSRMPAWMVEAAGQFRAGHPLQSLVSTPLAALKDKVLSPNPEVARELATKLLQQGRGPQEQILRDLARRYSVGEIVPPGLNDPSNRLARVLAAQAAVTTGE